MQSRNHDLVSYFAIAVLVLSALVAYKFPDRQPEMLIASSVVAGIAMVSYFRGRWLDIIATAQKIVPHEAASDSASEVTGASSIEIDYDEQLLRMVREQLALQIQKSEVWEQDELKEYLRKYVKDEFLEISLEPMDFLPSGLPKRGKSAKRHTHHVALDEDYCLAA